MNFDYLLTELQSKSNLDRDEIHSLVNDKYADMKDFITKEGAIYLVAKEIGIDLPERPTGIIPIGSVIIGMKNVNVIGRVFRISRIVDFSKSNGSKGRVANLLIGDSTGSIRVPIWDEQVKSLEDGSISMGDILQISNGFSRENNFGGIELSIGKFGAIGHLTDYDLPSVEQLEKGILSISAERSNISDTVPGGDFEIKGTIVNVFKGSFLFNVCPMCGNKIDENRCVEHGDVSPSPALVVSFIVDDGTGDIRCVMFKKSAEKICDLTSDHLAKLDTEARYNEISEKLLGKEFIFSGRIKQNKLFDRTEMMVNDFKDINPLEESNRLVEQLEMIIGV